MSIENPNTSLANLLREIVHTSSSGTHVTEQSALSLPAIYRGVDLISSKLARIPLAVYKRLPKGRSEDREHPAFRVLKRPHPNYGAMTFRQVLTEQALLHGNGYAFIGKTKAEPISLTILDPEQTYPVYINKTLCYKTQVDEKQIILGQDEVLHIKGLGNNGIAGFSVIHLLAESIGGNLALYKYGNVFFANNASPGTVIEFPTFFKDEEEIKKFKEGWNDFHKGLDNAHKMALVQNGAKVTRLTINNEEAQFLASKEFALKDIALILGLPPHKLGSNVGTSYASLELEERSLLEDTLSKWLVTWEEECERKLLSEQEKDEDSHFIEFKRDALITTDSRTELELLLQQLNNGILTLNQVNAIRNLPAIGPEGDKHRIPQNLTTIEDKASEVEAQAEQAKVEAEALANQPAPAEQPQQAPAPDKPAPDKRYETLLQVDLDRQLTRITKSIRSGKLDLAQHQTVFREALPTLDAGQIDRFFQTLTKDLEGSSPQDWANITDSLTAERFLNQYGN